VFLHRSTFILNFVPILMSIQHLTREISAIEIKTEALSAQIQEAYQDYLDRLGITVKRQLIAASYYLCTQLFPDVFLKLKYSDREKLQRSLQQIAEEATQRLSLAALGSRILEETIPKEDFFLDSEDSEYSEESEDLDDSKEEITENHLFTGNTSHPPAPSPQKGEGEPDQSPSPKREEGFRVRDVNSYEELEENIDEKQDNAVPENEPEESQPVDPSQPPSLKNPQVLLDWYSEIEQAIGDVLRQVSHRATHALERSGIIHNQLPEPLLEVATQSEAAENVGSDHPNILNLVVEMGKMNEEGRKSSTQRIEIVAIYLRLSDLEFTDTYLVSHRNKLRSQRQQLKSLSKIYHKRNRDYSIAQAEAAWRSSWID